MEAGYYCDTGLLREINEDSILCASFEMATHSGEIFVGLFVVADGMGGHNAGEIASDIAIRSLHAACISRLLAQCPDPRLSILASAVDEANGKILDAAGERELRGMGTTLTAALIIDGDMYVAHVGDSRCYIINNWETIRVTKDHSIVQELVDSGAITPEQARNHPRRNEITRVLGYSRDLAPDLHHIKLYQGDNILLCSDGLHSVLPPNAIQETVMNSPNPNQACIDLVSQANLAGGPDNISAILIKPGNLPSLESIITAQTSIRRLNVGS
jgi:serine/threonine protein phosphatase PrpC